MDVKETMDGVIVFDFSILAWEMNMCSVAPYKTPTLTLYEK